MNRYCEQCDNQLVRRAREPRKKWALRRYCSASCSAKNNRLGRRFNGRIWDPTELIRRSGFTHIEIAEVLGLTVDQVQQAKVRYLTEQEADEWACALGFHPAEIWGCWYWLDEVYEMRQQRRNRIEKRWREITRRRMQEAA